MKFFIKFFILLVSHNLTAQTTIENKTLGISFTPSPQIENTKDLETFIADLGRVELVYLEGNCEPVKSSSNDEDISKKPCIRETIIKSYDRIHKVVSWDSSYFSKKSDLNKSDLSDLFELLYGTKFKPEIGSESKAGCYNPRNGIVFYNTKNSAVGFLEICFECKQMDQTPDFPLVKSICDEELKLLKKLFEKNQIPTEEENNRFVYNRFHLNFESNKTTAEKEELTQFLDKVYRVEFVRLLGDCISPEYCRAKSIVYEFSDSTFQPKKNYFRQIVKVKKEDLNTIFNILYVHRIESNLITNTDCYEPRNGIVFYDKDNKVFAFFEICFQCRGQKTTKKIPKLDRLTPSDYYELRDLFEKYGINTKEN
jgi:hypothetical protein